MPFHGADPRRHRSAGDTDTCELVEVVDQFLGAVSYPGLGFERLRGRVIRKLACIEGPGKPS